MKNKKLKKVRDSIYEGTIYPLNESAIRFMRCFNYVFFTDENDFKTKWVIDAQKVYPDAKFGWKKGFYLWSDKTLIDKFFETIESLVNALAKFPSRFLNSSIEEQVTIVDPIVFELYHGQKIRNDKT